MFIYYYYSGFLKSKLNLFITKDLHYLRSEKNKTRVIPVYYILTNYDTASHSTKFCSRLNGRLSHVLLTFVNLFVLIEIQKRHG